MMWKLGSECLHDALSAAMWRRTHVFYPYFFIVPPRACKSHACGVRCGDSLLRGVSFECREVYMNSTWRGPGAVYMRFARERRACFTKLYVATVNLHRPFFAMRLSFDASRNAESSQHDIFTYIQLNCTRIN